MNQARVIQVIGAGLAGCEAALQLADRGYPVELWEMRPEAMTPAHQTGDPAELVCSNSLKSEAPGSAPYLLKEELRRLGSRLLQAADRCRVPAGQALAVDRRLFSRHVADALAARPHIRLVRQEARRIPDTRPVILATGPLTSDTLAAHLQTEGSGAHLYFYDAISPVIAWDSLDFSVAWAASRYGKGGDDYINCPLDRPAYLAFYEALVGAEEYPLRDFEQAIYFEGCLPIEELARRGVDTLRFGPMKPVGLVDPRTGREPYAAVQLRRESLLTDACNMVGFQNHLRFGEQRRVFRLIPGLQRAEFVRYGQMHRNTYLNAPRLLTPALEFRARPGLFIAGQLCGLEGYVEAIATGLLASLQVHRRLQDLPPLLFPRQTALGSLQHFLEHADPEDYQPVNMTFSLLPPPPPELKRRFRKKSDRNARRVEQILQDFEKFIHAADLTVS
ncbi:MAG: methylenetetrahydrofolate--tRNA-(uracil(54)-C(5))-methyltransferase (FADH(2)-oxidizing) TrmFO [Acidobacteria bacterium]|nr:methylenetetrahydrofolate--tRNA-(uracil(54)-C(5))-methyltransferase (FADH(2)-oxidizing) TrmFO [Acidobacteriota bacterium]